MIKVKYFFWARAIKACLQLGLFLVAINIISSIYIDVFNTRSYVNFAGGWFGYKTKGYFIDAKLHFSPADTVLIYENGMNNINIGDEVNKKHNGLVKLKETIVNGFRSSVGDDITIYNSVVSNENVQVRVFSKNIIHNIFWAVTNQLKSIITILFLLILTKLTNRYMDNEILLPRSFKLFSSLGWLLITKEILMFVVGFINMKLLQHPNFYTTSSLNGITNQALNITLNFTNTASLTNIGIGILIILLAQVLKQAIVMKQEQDLTI